MAVFITKSKHMHLIFGQKPKLQSASLNCTKEGMREEIPRGQEGNTTKQQPLMIQNKDPFLSVSATLTFKSLFIQFST